MSTSRPPWVAVTGKGGAGKSVIAGTLARILSRRGHRVLALDSDPMPGLTWSLGAEEPDRPPLLRAAPGKQAGRGRWLRPGIGPMRAVRDYTTEAPDGVRLLTLGKADTDGLASVQGSVLAYHAVVNRLHESKTLSRWTVIGDIPAGPRQVGSGFAGFARTFLVIVNPTAQSALAARRVARVAANFPDALVLFVASQVQGARDVKHVEKLLGTSTIGAVPRDQAVSDAERHGKALLDFDQGSPAVRAIEQIADALI